MYAIIEVGAKQYCVKKNDIIEVEKQKVQQGKELIIDKVLLLSKDKKVEVGQPYVKSAKVETVLLEHFLGDKKISFKYRRRKASHWKKGHRQKLSRIRIKEITLAS